MFYTGTGKMTPLVIMSIIIIFTWGLCTSSNLPCKLQYATCILRFFTWQTISEKQRFGIWYPTKKPIGYNDIGMVESCWHCWYDMQMLKFLENALQISSEPWSTRKKKEMDAKLEVESISHVVGVNICIYILWWWCEQFAGCWCVDNDLNGVFIYIYQLL